MSITKAKAGTGKIDPVIALFNAAKMMERTPEAGDGESLVYEERELIVL